MPEIFDKIDHVRGRFSSGRDNMEGLVRMATYLRKASIQLGIEIPEAVEARYQAIPELISVAEK